MKTEQIVLANVYFVLDQYEILYLGQMGIYKMASTFENIPFLRTNFYCIYFTNAS